MSHKIFPPAATSVRAGADENAGFEALGQVLADPGVAVFALRALLSEPPFSTAQAGVNGHALAGP